MNIKNIILAAAVAIATGCAKEALGRMPANNDTLATVTAPTTPADSVQYYTDKARWGDPTAYLKLAQYSHDGLLSGKPDMLNTLSWYGMAQLYGAIPDTDEAIAQLPDGDWLKTAYTLMDGAMNLTDKEAAATLIDQMMASGIPDAYVLQALSVRAADPDAALGLLRKGTDEGSALAKLCWETAHSSTDLNDNPEMMERMADVMPIANMMLGQYYSGQRQDSVIDYDKAIVYYRKAEQKATLDSWGANFLLWAIRENLTTPADSTETSRLKALSNANPNHEEDGYGEESD